MNQKQIEGAAIMTRIFLTGLAKISDSLEKIEKIGCSLAEVAQLR